MPFLLRPFRGRRTMFIFIPVIGIHTESISAILVEPTTAPSASLPGPLTSPIRAPRPTAVTIPPAIGPPIKSLIASPDDLGERKYRLHPPPDRLSPPPDALISPPDHLSDPPDGLDSSPDHDYDPNDRLFAPIDGEMTEKSPVFQPFGALSRAKFQRDLITQPGLALSDYPGNAIQQVHQPVAERVESIPHIPFVEFDLVSAQQLPKFVLKRNHAMMFLLPGDVFAHGFNLRKTDGENPVVVLPREIREVG